MTFNISAKQMTLTDDLRLYAEKKTGKIDRLFRNESDAFVNLSRERGRFTAEVTLKNNGMIYRDPDYDSTVAAMLCLDGVKEAGDSLYFNVNRLNSWANRTKTYVATIGDHTFYM